MKTSLSQLVLLLLPVLAFSQNLYFPPLTGSTWETLSPASLGWCEDKIQPLYDFLDEENTKAFIVLKDGKIVLEKYFDNFTQDSFWYWASAGKTVTSMLVGIAQQEGFLSIEDKTSDYLGTGWTACPPEKEALITVRHQLTMTSGLDDGVEDPYCTLDTCLVYEADAGSRWAYHNGPYTLLDKVIESATGSTLNNFYLQKLRSKTGMNGLFLPAGYNNVLFTNARSMARFGLLALNGGNWNNTPVLNDPAFFEQSVNTSQDLNLSYGYLWWLNGKATFMVPELQIVFPGSLFPDAPLDMFAAMGKNGQFINVVPSQRLVLVRMGEAPDNSLVPYFLNNLIWQYLKDVICENTTAVKEKDNYDFYLSPNPADQTVRLHFPDAGNFFHVEVYNLLGERQIVGYENGEMDVRHLPSGMYLVRVTNEASAGKDGRRASSFFSFLMKK